MRTASLAFVSLVLAASASAQSRPFVFTTTTTASEPDGKNWAVYYDTAYADHAAAAIGYDGIEQRVGLQGRLGRRLTLTAHVALSSSDVSMQSTQEVEILKDLLGSSSRLRLAVGVGGEREWEGTTTALARLCLGWSSQSTLLFGNLRLEKPFAVGRDSVDLISTLGWLQTIRPGLRLGAEAVGEDLEGLWVPGEAEGGARLFVGPALHWSTRSGRIWLSAEGGPILYATHSPLVSPAPRELGATRNGVTVRASVGYTFSASWIESLGRARTASGRRAATSSWAASTGTRSAQWKGGVGPRRGY